MHLNLPPSESTIFLVNKARCESSILEKFAKDLSFKMSYLLSCDMTEVGDLLLHILSNGRLAATNNLDTHRRQQQHVFTPDLSKND